MTQQSIVIPEWWKSPNGGMIRRECLEPEHPGSTYSYIKNEIGLTPEDFGVNDREPYSSTLERWGK